MKGHKLLALLMALLLCIQLLPVSTAFAEEVSEDGISVTSKANSTSYGDVTAASSTGSLTSLKDGDTVELIATPKENGHETFSQWVVYKNSSCTTKADPETDYTLTETETGKATLTVKGTTDLWVMAVFQGKIVGLQDKSNYAPLPATRGKSKNLRSLFSITKDATVSGIIASATITGWDNDPTVPLVATITLPSNPTEVVTGAWRLQVWETAAGFGNSAGADAVHYNMMLAPGARFDFSGLTKDSKRSSTYNQTSYSFGEGWDWTEYSFNIVDSEGTVLKSGKIVFKYSGLATIEAKNGSVKCGENTYTDGQTVNLGTGEKKIEAVPAEGYFFTGWEISGVTLDDATANPLTFTMPSVGTTIKANFAKTVSVTLKANSADYGDVTSSSTLTGLKDGDTVELTATPKENGHETFSQWVVYKNSSCTTKADPETDYTLTETETGKATLTVKGTTDLWVMAVFQGKIVGLQDKSNYAPLPATRGKSKNLRSLFSITKDATVSGIIASATITGWDNDPTVPLVATITLPSNPTEVVTGAWRLQVWETAAGFGNSAGADAVHYNMMLAPGARFDFSGLTKDSKRSSTYNQTSYSFGEGWDWTEYSFNIVDSEGTVLKSGKIVFKYSGLATIEAKNGSVKCGENTYTDGQTVNLGTGEKKIEAVPAEGYFFTGWEISGVTLDDATANPLTFTMPSAGTTIKANFAQRPELGYQLSIEGNGKVFVDGVERANGYMTEVADNTSVVFLAEPAEGYVLDHWEITSPIKDVNIPDSSGNLKQLYITTAYGGQFYNVKAAFAEKATYKLRFKLMLGETDVTRSNDFKAACGRQDVSIPYSAYTFPSAMTVDEIYSSLSTGKSISDFYLFNAGLNYLDFPVDSEDWIVIQLNQYPGYTEQLGPKFIADGFVSSNEAAVADRRSISNSRFGGRTYIVFKMTQDTTITANIHEAKYTTVTVPTDETKGTVTITPAADVEALGVWWEGSKLTVQAVPAEGYRFARWQESTGGYIKDENAAKNPLNITLGANDANFAPVFEAAEAVDRSITKVVDPEGKATITINGSSDTIQVREGTVVSLGIDVDEYYLFDHWNVTQNGVESPDNLVISENQTSKSATFIMPFGESGVTVQAVLKDRYTGLSTLVYLMTGNNGSTAAAKGLTTVSLSKNGTPLTDVNCQVQKGDELEIAVTMLNENYVLREIVVYDMVSNKAIQTITDAQGTITIPRWSSWQIAVRIEEKTADTERHSISLTQPTTGGTISSSNTTSQPDKTITLTAVPDSGYVLKKWIVKDAQENAISVTTDNNVGTFTMPKSDVTVTAEFVSSAEVTPEITSVALLQGESGTEIATGVLSGDKWTITIPDTVPAETVAKIPEGLSGLYLKIVTPAGVTVKQGQFEGDWSQGDWSQGDIMCYMPVNEEVTFQAIAGTATKDYTIKLVYSGSPLLSNGSATRTSKTGATVKFTSSEAGNYFYKVVDHGAAAPTVDTSKNGTSAVQGENTITLSNLGDGARDIYIVVVDASNNRSVVLKIEIPAYGSIDVPDTGAYTITVKAPKGGTITPNRTKANAGDEIIVTVTPDSGYQMVADSLTYTLAVSGGETVKITNNRFAMPEGNVSISCQWETAATTSTGITGFSINGVAGAVNNTTNTITITMPRGTDVTKLTPVIATNGVKSLTPGNGETVDFTNAVTYTAAMEDGSSKTYTVTVYVDKGTLADQFWDRLTDFATQVPWWQYAEKQQSTSKYPKYW